MADGNGGPLNDSYWISQVEQIGEWTILLPFPLLIFRRQLILLLLLFNHLISHDYHQRRIRTEFRQISHRLKNN